LPEADAPLVTPALLSGTTHGLLIGRQPLWQALYDGYADLVLQGHERCEGELHGI